MEEFVQSINDLHLTGSLESYKKLKSIISATEDKSSNGLSILFKFATKLLAPNFSESSFLLSKYKVDKDRTLDVYYNSQNISSVLKTIDEKYEKYFYNEVFYQSILYFPYINTIYNVDFGTKSIKTKTQPLGSLDLMILMKESSPLQYSHLMKIMYKIGLAIEYYFSHDIAHRDIKPHNIFISDDLEPYLSDFGITREIPERKEYPCTQNTGTNSFKSPLVKHQHYPKEIDIYSMMCTFVYVFSSIPPPYYSKKENQQSITFFDTLKLFPDEISKTIIDCFLKHNQSENAAAEFTIQKFLDFVINAAEHTNRVLKTIQETQIMEGIIQSFENSHYLLYQFLDSSKELLPFFRQNCLVKKAVGEWILTKKPPFIEKNAFLEIKNKLNDLMIFRKTQFNIFNAIKVCKQKYNNGYDKNAFLTYIDVEQKQNQIKIVSPFAPLYTEEDTMNYLTVFASSLCDGESEKRVNVIYNDKGVFIAGHYFISKNRLCAIQYDYGSTLEAALSNLPLADSNIMMNEKDKTNDIEKFVKIREVLPADLTAYLSDDDQKDSTWIRVIQKGQALDAIGVFICKYRKVSFYYDEIYIGTINLEESKIYIIKVSVNFARKLTINTYDLNGIQEYRTNEINFFKNL